MARKKAAVLTPPNYKEAQILLRQYAEMDAKQVEKQAQLDQEIIVLREQSAADLNELIEGKKELLIGIQLFAETNRDKHFSDKKSVDMQHGIIGFRTGTPKLSGVPRKGEKLDKTLAYFNSYAPDYVRTKVELNKELIIADREKDELKTHLRTQSLKITQAETFFIELKKEEIEN